jgi:hypothetical protein
MDADSAARRYRFEARQLRQMAREAHSENIRQDLKALARQYEELADYVEVMAKRGARAGGPTKKRPSDAPGHD